MAKASSGAEFVAEAKKFVGVPYVWGGAGPSGFDCSGLVQYCLEQIGIKNVPRTSEAQWSWSKHISESQLQPGDLIFEQWPGDTGGAPGHVIIYAGRDSHGQKMVVEAPQTGQDVHVRTWNDKETQIVGYGVPAGMSQSGSGGTDTPSGQGPSIGPFHLPNLNPTNYLLNNLGADNLTDLIERGALILFGAILLIMGVIKLFPGATGDAAEAVGLATGQPEIAAAGAAVKGRSKERARSRVRNNYNERHAPDKDQEKRIMASARERNKTKVVLGPNADGTDRRMAGESAKGNPGGAVPKNLDVTDNDEPPF